MVVEVVAESAEVLAGDDVVAQVRRGQRLTYLKKNGEYYLVLVGGKKGWISSGEVRELANASPVPERIGPPVKESSGARASAESPDGKVEVVATDAGTIKGKVKGKDTPWTYPANEDAPRIKDPILVFATKG
jgi:uncharacterized protein YgiM (DUF1202 family)